ncbi:hypothetical protein [Siminovitchia fortis]|uniref:hypothetical protein n=1 Tax=Siminovitchia fortis TaxID=254758 RepID=UPI0013E381F0|nr:hypothetical protein [Siminovitchia fortis]WHY82614.1 hypothetical protein QNH23_04300 [Siminovitchia fortis]
MDIRDNHCKACHGTGMLADDEGWQYKCSVCRGSGFVSEENYEARIVEVDENNRLLD